MSVHVAEFTGTGVDWDAFVRAQKGWTHFHLYGWKRLIETVFGHETAYLCASDGETLRGVLPLVRVRSAVFGHYLVSMPFLNYGGPLGDPDAVRALCSAAVSLADRSEADLLEVRSRCELPVELAVSHRKITVLLDLNGEKPLWDRLDAKVRSQVRRPAKSGVTFRIGGNEVEPFHAVYAAHMRDLGTPAQPLRLFAALRDAFGDDVWYGCAYLNGRPVASGCGFLWGSEFEMTWAAASIEHKSLAANMGLYWRFMEHAIEEGLHTFNFGRCTPGGGTHRFKRQWGGRDEPLWWYTHSAAAGTTAQSPSPDNGKWSWGPRIWRRLPRRVATAIGPHIVRWIP